MGQEGSVGMKTETKGLRRKLASRRGAAITFALLLFLVCATVGVIVLVAGTTASGRLSKLSETDRRYYAVQSAAQLLREEIEGSSVTITRKLEPNTFTQTTVTNLTRYRTAPDAPWQSYYVTTVTETLSYSTVEWPTTAEQPAINAVGAAGSRILPFLQEAAEKYILGEYYGAELTGGAKAAYWNQEYTPYGDIKLQDNKGPFTLTLEDAKDSAGNPLNAADVTISAKLDIYGNLLVQLSSGEGENTYIVTMTFSPTDVPAVEYPELPTTSSPTYTSGNAPTDALETDVAEPVTEVSAPIEYNAEKQDVITWTFDGMTVGA